MSDAKTSLLQVNPPRELVFNGPFTDVVTAVMELKNKTNKSVCFKVKTTAPKQYCVRPNSGVLQGGETKEVTVMLQPMESIPADASRHKFMVQSCYTPSDDVDLDSVWKSANSDMTYSKLMVVFNDKASNFETKGEESYTSAHVSALGASTAYNHQNDSIDAGTVASLRKSLQTAVEEKDSLSKKVGGLEEEIEALRKNNRKLLQSKGDGALMDGNFPTLQVILIAFATLLIGLIVGKLI